MNICLIIGSPVGHSLSPVMHNAGFKKLGIDDKFIYMRKEVLPENLKEAVDEIRNLNIKGVSVTMPHKQTIMQYLDYIDPEAQIIGSINTIVNNHGKLTGFNTDCIGAMIALERKTSLKGKKVALIGAGGTARALIFGLKQRGAIVKIFNRSEEKAENVAKEFCCEYSNLDSLNELEKMDIIINATSVGMNENKSPINKKFLNKKHIVFDVIYSPKETKLIKDAKKIGAKVILGHEMLLYEGAKQFKMYTGLDAPIKSMGIALIKHLK